MIAGAGSEGSLHAIRLAVEVDRELNGPPAVDTLLMIEVSSRSAPALAVADELAAVAGIVAVVGHANSSASLATSQVYNRRGIVQIAPTSTAPLYSEAGPFSFRLVPPDDVQGAFLARMVADSFPDASRVAVLYVNDDYGRALRTRVVERLEPHRAEVVLDLPHLETDTAPFDMQHHLATLEATEPDLIVWIGRVPAMVDLIPEIRARLGPVPVVGSDGLSGVSGFPVGDPDWENVFHTDFVDMEGSPALREFRERFRARFDQDAGGADALFYDAARLLLAAIREGSRSGEEIREYLMGLGRDRPPFPGITGPIRFDEHGDVERFYILRHVGATPEP